MVHGRRLGAVHRIPPARDREVGTGRRAVNAHHLDTHARGRSVLYTASNQRILTTGRILAGGVPLKNSGIPLLSNAWFIGSTRVHTPNDSLIGSVVLAQLLVMSNRHTPHKQLGLLTQRHHGSSATIGHIFALCRPTCDASLRRRNQLA